MSSTPYDAGDGLRGAAPISDAVAASTSKEHSAMPVLFALACLPRHRATRRRSQVERRPTLTSLSHHGHCGSPTYARWAHPVQLRPLCLWHSTGDTRLSLAAPFRLLLPVEGRHCSRRSKISWFEGVNRLHDYPPPAPSRRTGVPCIAQPIAPILGARDSSPGHDRILRGPRENRSRWSHATRTDSPRDCLE